MKKLVEFVCSACGKDSILIRKPLYEGFRKTGDRLICSSCSHEYASEADVPFTSNATPEVFSDEDKSPTLNIFSEDEGKRTCRHCGHYVVNPFTQRCGLHAKLVAATDFCDDFQAKESEPDSPKERSC